MFKNLRPFNSIHNAINGIKYLLKNESNSRIHLAATIFVIALSVWVKLTVVEWVGIAIAIALVWSAELFNTAIEIFFDLVEPNPNQLVKIGKDTSAGAVLIMAILSVVIGILILGPAIYQNIFNNL